MASPANERFGSSFSKVTTLLAPSPGRLEFAARLALICALTTLLVEIYQTPEPAITIYLVLFVIKPDHMMSIVASTVMLVLITLIIGFVLLVTMQVMDQPFWRVIAMTSISFGLLFLASASKLKPIAGTVALITAYALDLLGTAHAGEVATRALLYAWLFVGMPAGICIVVNLVLGPPPRRLAEKALARRLCLCATMLRAPVPRIRRSFDQCLREGPAEIFVWIKLAAAEKTSSANEIAALRQAACSTAVILSTVEVIAQSPEKLVSETHCERIAQTLDEMAAILLKGGYPIDVVLDVTKDEIPRSVLASAVLAELVTALMNFADPRMSEPSPEPAKRSEGGFFLPDAFTNPAHVRHAIKTTTAAMFCYVVYSLLDWPGIHTCLITCFIVSLGTTAETVEKLILRILGCLVGAGMGIAAIVFLMPSITTIGALMVLVFVAALVSGWIVAGSPRISYVGFQIAFAFFLCVVQGSSPAFDMTLARDRVIGILFGNLVVALVFTTIWPSSVARRVDPAIAILLRKLSAMTEARNLPARWTLAAEAQTTLGGIQQDITLTRYEPSSIRPAAGWLERRKDATRVLPVLQGLLLIGVDQHPSVSTLITYRLNRLAATCESSEQSVGVRSGAAERTHYRSPELMLTTPASMDAFIEVPLETLEQALGQPTETGMRGRASDAFA